LLDETVMERVVRISSLQRVGRRVIVLAACAAVLGILATAGLIVPGAAAQDDEEIGDLPPPPALSREIVRDSLAGPTIFPSGTCPTGRALGGNADGAFVLTVAGKCLSGSSVADVAVPGRGITVPDGDVSVAFKVVEGRARAGVNLYVRVRGKDSLAGYVNLGTGEATLLRLTDGAATPLASRLDANTLAEPGAWNRLAIRASASDLWLLLNLEPILYAANVPTDAGGVGVRLLREGSPDDEYETTVAFGDLVVAAIAETDPSRDPTYQRP
jgi:hypothetical protein